MLERTGRELDSQTGMEAANAVTAYGSQLGHGVRGRQDNLGIEDSDPRWSEREGGSGRRRSGGSEPEPDMDLGSDASDFQGQPTDPFAVLIKRRERSRRRLQEDQPQQILLATGIEALDEDLGPLTGRLYLLTGAPEPARALLHQIACHVAASHPVLYVATVGNPRDLVLKALARVAGTAAPGDLARARDVAERFRPIRERLAIVTPEAAPGVPQIRARLVGSIRHYRARGALLVLDDLAALAQGVSQVVPAAAPGAPTGPAGQANPVPRRVGRWQPPGPPEAEPMQREAIAEWVRSLSILADDLGVPVLAVGPAVEGPARMELGPITRSGGPVDLTLVGVGRRSARARNPGPLAVPLLYDPARATFESAPAP